MITICVDLPARGGDTEFTRSEPATSVGYGYTSVASSTMPASPRRSNRGGRTLKIAFWAGAGLAPLAALALLVGQDGSPIRVAAVLAILSVVLIGSSVRFRRDGDGLREELEDLEEHLTKELARLRTQLRKEVAATDAALREELDVLRSHVRFLGEQTAQSADRHTARAEVTAVPARQLPALTSPALTNPALTNKETTNTHAASDAPPTETMAAGMATGRNDPRGGIRTSGSASIPQRQEQRQEENGTSHFRSRGRSVNHAADDQADDWASRGASRGQVAPGTTIAPVASYTADPQPAARSLSQPALPTTAATYSASSSSYSTFSSSSSSNSSYSTPETTEARASTARASIPVTPPSRTSTETGGTGGRSNDTDGRRARDVSYGRHGSTEQERWERRTGDDEQTISATRTDPWADLRTGEWAVADPGGFAYSGSGAGTDWRATGHWGTERRQTGTHDTGYQSGKHWSTDSTGDVTGGTSIGWRSESARVPDPLTDPLSSLEDPRSTGSGWGSSFGEGSGAGFGYRGGGMDSDYPPRGDHTRNRW